MVYRSLILSMLAKKVYGYDSVFFKFSKVNALTRVQNDFSMYGRKPRAQKFIESTRLGSTVFADIGRPYCTLFDVA